MIECIWLLEEVMRASVTLPLSGTVHSRHFHSTTVLFDPPLNVMTALLEYLLIKI